MDRRCCRRSTVIQSFCALCRRFPRGQRPLLLFPLPWALQVLPARLPPGPDSESSPLPLPVEVMFKWNSQPKTAKPDWPETYPTLTLAPEYNYFPPTQPMQPLPGPAADQHAAAVPGPSITKALPPGAVADLDLEGPRKGTLSPVFDTGDDQCPVKTHTARIPKKPANRGPQDVAPRAPGGNLEPLTQGGPPPPPPPLTHLLDSQEPFLLDPEAMGSPHASSPGGVADPTSGDEDDRRCFRPRSRRPSGSHRDGYNTATIILVGVGRGGGGGRGPLK